MKFHNFHTEVKDKETQEQNVQLFTWVRLNFYLHWEKIAFPVFRKLGKLLIRLSEYRKSKFRKSLERLQSQR